MEWRGKTRKSDAERRPRRLELWLDSVRLNFGLLCRDPKIQTDLGRCRKRDSLRHGLRSEGRSLIFVGGEMFERKLRRQNPRRWAVPRALRGGAADKPG